MTTEPYTKKLATIVGREGEKKVIRQAVEGVGSPIVFVEGVGGIGKTALIEQAEHYAAMENVLWPPLIDFYDTAMHSNQGLEAVIARSLDQGKTYFKDYWNLREQEPQKDLWDTFLKGYARCAENTRVVLRFDTAERLEYERDPEPVRRDLGFADVEKYEAPSWNWLLRRAGSLPNTAVLIAARPTHTGYLKRQLSNQYPNKVRFLDLSGLKYEETKAYVRDAEIGPNLYVEAPKLIRRVHQLSKGRPILIALTLDWLRRGDWDRRILEEIDDSDFERALVQQIRNLETSLDTAVRYAALCRKGYNADLLAQLMEIGLEDAKALVEQMKDLAFVKAPRQRMDSDSQDDSHQTFFFHDEMYDLVERHVWELIWPGYEEQERLDQLIIKWYGDRIEHLSQKMGAHLGWRERGELRRKQQLLYTEQLYYQLDKDPKAGYREYSHRTEEAIGAREMEWDIWLRNEFLGFIAHRAPRWLQVRSQLMSEMEHDARRFWINRFTAKEDYARAIRVAERLQELDRQHDEPALYRGGLLIALATAQAYSGVPHIEAALSNFVKGVALVEPYMGVNRDPWLPRYMMGTAYLYQGLALRSARPLAEAVEAYARAISHFSSIDYQPGLNEAINNLAFVTARLGLPKQAEAICDDALETRKKLGDEYNIALSLNTKGIIQERLDQPLAAIRYSKEASNIFFEIGRERGIIMAAINLGRAYRRKARSPHWDQRDQDFKQGERYLKMALDRQNAPGKNAETYYRIQTYNELGCLYRDWAAVLVSKNPQAKRIGKFLVRARNNLDQAAKLARGNGNGEPEDPLQYVDSREDLARVYYLWALADPTSKDVWLEEMDQLLTEVEELAGARVEGHKEYLLVLGKAHFQRARRALELYKPRNAAEYFALATGNIEEYSTDAPELTKFAQEASNWLKRYKSLEAQEFINIMRKTVEEEQLPSERLQKWIEAVVKPRLGVGWNVEADHG